jgi:hypothetical protein
MSAFSQVIEGWHDFYLMTGTAAATLVGLLFVSLALNVEAITHPNNTDLRAMATQTFTTFVNVVLLSILFLIPHQVTLGLGLPLLGVSAFGLLRTMRRYGKARHQQPRTWGSLGVTSRFLIPLICFTGLIIIAILVLLNNTDCLYWIVPVIILWLVSALRNAWDLLLRMRETPKAT